MFQWTMFLDGLSKMICPIKITHSLKISPANMFSSFKTNFLYEPIQHFNDAVFNFDQYPMNN